MNCVVFSLFGVFRFYFYFYFKILLCLVSNIFVVVLFLKFSQ
jgi:hypothetical protein